MTRSKLFLCGALLTSIGATLLVMARLLLEPETASVKMRSAVDAAFVASQVGLFLLAVSAVRHLRQGFAVIGKNRKNGRPSQSA